MHGGFLQCFVLWRLGFFCRSLSSYKGFSINNFMWVFLVVVLFEGIQV